MSIVADSHIAVHFAQTMARMSENRKKYKLSPVVSLSSIIAQVQSNRSIERSPATVIRSVMHAVPAGLLRVQATQDLEKLTEIYHKRYVLAPNDARLNEIMLVLPDASEIRSATEVSGYTKRTISGVRDTKRYLARQAKKQTEAIAEPKTPEVQAPVVKAPEVKVPAASPSLATGALDSAFVRELSALCLKHNVSRMTLEFNFGGRHNQVTIQGDITQGISGNVNVDASSS